ncbi:MAG: phenylalanine--tRNA ligase subunit beta [Patescibacteria group bacterium]
MLISRNWLQTFFESKLPDREKLSNGITMHAFEVEGVEEKQGDEVFDVKVLPNRAHDCLCHYGLAKEVAAIFEIPLSRKMFVKTPRTFPQSNEFSVEIKTEKVKRFKTLKINGVKVGESPKWLKNKIEVLGGRSINNVVDITNFVMLELGQPMHAFDADKITSDGGVSSFIVREAKNGEKITTLDGVERFLKEGALLITDGGNNGKTILGIAGIKGGSSSEIDLNTKSVILEAANFDAPTIRKHSKLLNIRTDASIRFENGISEELPLFAIEYALDLIEQIAKGDNFQVEGEFDFKKVNNQEREIGISLKEINNILGTKLDTKEVEKILSRLEFSFQENNNVFKVTAPFERLDLEIPEDIAEEVGRIYGFEHIGSVLPDNLSQVPEINQDFYRTQKIREVLKNDGYSEVQTYAMVSEGVVEIENPIATDKSFMRENLENGVGKSLELNARNSPILGLESLKIFEIGVVFANKREETHLCLGTFSKGKINTEEYSLKGVYEKFAIANVDEGEIARSGVDERSIKYRSISPYPFILRDIAIFVLENVKSNDLEKIIEDDSGEYLVRIDKFDEFKKGEKISYAYHLVFQSVEKTLTDSEINEVMEKLTKILNGKTGWQVR